MEAGKKTAIVAGMFALLGTIAGATITGWSNLQLSRQEFYSKLIMKSLESKSADERLETLQLLVEVNLIKDKEVKDGVKAYTQSKMKNPETIPRIRPDTVAEQVKLSVEVEDIGEGPKLRLGASAQTAPVKILSFYRHKINIFVDNSKNMHFYLFQAGGCLYL